MKKWIHVAVVGVLLFAGASGLHPSFAEDGSAGTDIGTYKRLTTNELTPDHVSWVGEHLEVEGPALTSEFTVRTDYLEKELGPWAADRAFVPGDGTAVIDGRRALFMPLEIGPAAVFTWGDESQVAFMERPMWVSAQQDTYGGPITLALEDGDQTGQEVFISRSWLWQYGITWFNVTHEDGTVLPVSDVGSGVVVDVHHFSDVVVNPEGLDVKKLVGGLHLSNQGETRWFWKESILEVDVDYNPTEVYEIFLPAGWLDVHVRPEYYRIHKGDSVTVDIEFGTPNATLNGEDYYRVSFKSTETTNMIEILGLHIPVYALENNELVPHWEEKTWVEDDYLLNISVAEKSENYQLVILKQWVEDHLPQALVLHNDTGELTKNGSLYNYANLTAPETPTDIQVFSLPHNPDPADASRLVDPTRDALSWHGTKSIPASVYLEDSHFRINLTKAVAGCTETAATSCSEISLNPGWTYFWQVKYNVQSVLIPGPVWTFRTDPNYGPSKPEILAPSNGFTVQNSTVELSWSNVNHTHNSPTSYTVFLDAWNHNPVQAQAGCIDISEQICIVDNLSSGILYSWRVIAQDQHSGSNSSVSSFKVAGETQLYDHQVVRESIMPRNGSIHERNHVVLTWTPSTNLTGFDIYMDEVMSFQDDNETSEYLFNDTMPPLRTMVCENVQTECAVGPLESETFYQWAIVSTGLGPANSTSLLFRTDWNVSFSELQSIFPHNASVGVSRFAYLYWEGPQNPEITYRTYITNATLDWELECITTTAYCEPRHLELGQTYNWKVEASYRGAVYSSDLPTFTVATAQEASMPKTLLMVHGYKAEHYERWQDIVRLLVHGDEPPNSLPAYDRVVPIAYYGGECWVHPRGEAYKEGSHTELKPWGHTDNKGCKDRRYHWKESHIEHLAFHVAWFIYNRYTSQEAAVDIVSHSMGGLIIQYAMTIAQMNSTEYSDKYDRKEFPRYCEKALLWKRDCWSDNSSTRGSWPDSLAVKDVVSWGVPHKGVKEPADCWLWNSRQLCQMIQDGDGYGSLRFLNWIEEHAQNPQTTSDMLPHGTSWTLVGSQRDQVVARSSYHGMDSCFLKFYYEYPNYSHSAAYPVSSPVYYEDASTTLNGEGSHRTCSSEPSHDARAHLLQSIGSDEMPRTGYYLYMLGTDTWDEVGGYWL